MRNRENNIRVELMLQNLTNMQSNTVKNTARLTLTVGALIFFLNSIFGPFLAADCYYCLFTLHYYSTITPLLENGYDNVVSLAQ